MEEPSDDTWVDRTWMAYSRSILLVLAVGALLVRGAYLRDLSVWICGFSAVPSVVLATAMLIRMRQLSRKELHTRARVLVAMSALVLACAIIGTVVAVSG